MLALVRKYPVQFFVLAVIGWYAVNMLGPNSSTASAVLGFLLVFLVPGYSWVISMNYADPLEEFVVAIAVSISLVIMSLIFVNMALGLRITQASVFVDVALISLAGLGYWRQKDKINSSLPPWAKKLVS